MQIKNRSNKFLIASIFIVILTCIIVFGVLIKTTNRRNAEMIGNIGSIYMEGMNERIAAHFETIFSLRLASAEGIVSLDPPDSFRDPSDIIPTLVYSAKASDFTFCAFARGEVLTTLYGPEAYLVLPEKFKENVINKNESIVTTGKCRNGEYLVLIAIPADYEMPDGSRSDALVLGVSVDFVKQVLSIEHTKDALVYSQLIRSDGSFVLKDDKEYDSYFDRFVDKAVEYEEKKPEDYVAEMKDAIANNTSFSAPYKTNSNTGHMYFTPLHGTEWYLITFMPYGKIDETISDLNKDWINMVILSCGSILMVLLIIFTIYFNMNRHQMHELENARMEALHATKAKSEFLSNMSHDIRTPMNAIVGMTSIAAANIDDKQQVRSCLNKITLSSKHLLGLINDILDMSKIESGKMTLNKERASLREIMDSVVGVMQPQIKAKDQHFDVCVYDITSENVFCDSLRINQVLINLLSNAVKFTPENGNISVSLGEEISPLGEKYTRICISVKDNGIGMSPEFQKQVFETFMREDRLRVHRTEGTGLGMAITKYIVDAMGGNIECDSEQGKGTEFRVTADLETAPSEEKNMLLPECDILFADSSEKICRNTAAALKETSISADWALDGISAVKMAAERHNSGNDYKIILLDIELAGTDGIETAKRIRSEIGGDIPIILVSAYDWSGTEAAAKEAGINGFISKPLFRSTLYDGLKGFIIPESSGVPAQAKTKTNLKGHRILLSEDNDLNWEIAETLLAELGLEIDRAEDGQVCVSKFETSEKGYYDAILMDIRMPVMTGYEAAEIIRKLDREDSDIPIIAMTADAFAEDVQKCMESGMNAHISKPIDIDEVAKILEKYLKK